MFVTVPVLSFRDVKFLMCYLPRICKDIFSRTFYRLMVYCKLQCQNLSIYMYIHWSDTWYGESILSGGTLIYVWVDWLIQYYFAVGYSDNFILYILGKKMFGAHFDLVLYSRWFYIIQYRYVLLDFVTFFWKWFCYLKDLSRHLILGILTVLQS